MGVNEEKKNNLINKYSLQETLNTYLFLTSMKIFYLNMQVIEHLNIQAISTCIKKHTVSIAETHVLYRPNKFQRGISPERIYMKGYKSDTFSV